MPRSQFTRCMPRRFDPLWLIRSNGWRVSVCVDEILNYRNGQNARDPRTKWRYLSRVPMRPCLIWTTVPTPMSSGFYGTFFRFVFYWRNNLSWIILLVTLKQRKNHATKSPHRPARLVACVPGWACRRRQLVTCSASPRPTAPVLAVVPFRLSRRMTYVWVVKSVLNLKTL